MNLQLSNNATAIIRDSFEHYAENELAGGDLTQANEYQHIANTASAVLDNPNTVFRLQTQELVPLTFDGILNIAILSLISLPSDGDERVQLGNEIWTYLDEKYNFDPELHQEYLNKATEEEAFTYALKKIESEWGMNYPFLKETI